MRLTKEQRETTQRAEAEIIEEIRAGIPRMRAICAPGGKRDQEERDFMLHISSLLDFRFSDSFDWSWWTPVRGLYHDALRITYNMEKSQNLKLAESEVRKRLLEMRKRIRERPHQSRESASEYIQYLTKSVQHIRRIWSLESRASELMAGLATVWSQLDERIIERAIKTLAKARIRIRKANLREITTK